MTVLQLGDVYVDSLIPLCEGYPVWNPGNNSLAAKDGVQIGDVGWFNANGTFVVLFNACLPRKHERNKRVPDSFVPLDGMGDVETGGLIGQHESLHSINLDRPIPTIRSLGEAILNNEPLLEYKVLCKGEAGAIVMIPNGAVRKSLSDTKEFKRYAHLHAESWFRLAGGGEPIPDRDLYLVTGVTKAQTWANMAYTRTRDSPIYTISARLNRYLQTTWGFGTGKLSPDQISRHHYACKESSIPPPDRKNQAIFISGFVVTLNEEESEYEIFESQGQPRARRHGYRPQSSSRPSAASSRSNWFSFLPTFSNWNLNPRVYTANIETFLDTSQLFHPLQHVNRNLLAKHPSAKLAITHDSDLALMIDEDETYCPRGEELLLRAKDRFRTITSSTNRDLIYLEANAKWTTDGQTPDDKETEVESTQQRITKRIPFSLPRFKISTKIAVVESDGNIRERTMVDLFKSMIDSSWLDEHDDSPQLAMSRLTLDSAPSINSVTVKSHWRTYKYVEAEAESLRSVEQFFNRFHFDARRRFGVIVRLELNPPSELPVPFLRLWTAVVTVDGQKYASESHTDPRLAAELAVENANMKLFNRGKD